MANEVVESSNWLVGVFEGFDQTDTPDSRQSFWYSYLWRIGAGDLTGRVRRTGCRSVCSLCCISATCGVDSFCYRLVSSLSLGNFDGAEEVNNENHEL